MRAAVPRVAMTRKPISVSRRASVTAAALSLSLTEMKAVPASGSFTPGAELGLQEGALEAELSRPITSPVDFISGPRMTSTLGKRLKGKTASFTATWRWTASSSRSNSLQAARRP